jgi:hypothetical protein
MWLRGRSGTSRRLELLNLHLSGYDGDPDSGILIFWESLKMSLSLRVLVIDNFHFNNALRNIRIRGRVIWRGAQIAVGLQKNVDMVEEWVYNPSKPSETFDMPQVV